MIEPIKITREFNTFADNLWDAWTKPEVVSKWWGPEGFSCPSVKIDLKIGRKYVFCMRGPKGSAWDRDMYSSGVYKEILPTQYLRVSDYFSDKDGNKIAPDKEGMDPNFPDESDVTIRFENLSENKSRLTIEYSAPATQIQYDAIMKSGMIEGWNSSLNKLEALF